MAFELTLDLQQVVVAAVRDAEAQPPVLDFAPLAHDVTEVWLEHPTDTRRPFLEIVVHPLPSDYVTDRVFGQATQRLAGVMRSEGIVSQLAGLELTESSSLSIVRAVTQNDRVGWGDVQPFRFRSAYLRSSGQFGATFTLASDQMSSLLDRQDATGLVTSALRLAHRMEYITSARCAVALRVTERNRVSVGTIPSSSRQAASLGFQNEDAVLIPDESVPTEALDIAAPEIARTSIDQLLRAMR